MIRPLSFAVLMCSAAIVLAQPLYKWVEPDGSITFSVKPPPAGIEFETVNASGDGNTTKQEAASAMQSQMQPNVTAAQPEARLPVQPTQRLAPQLGAQTTLQQGIQRSTARLPDESNSRNNRATQTQGRNGYSAVSGNNQEPVVAIANKTRKQRQCEDLRKRVVSLERRLRNRLTPEDMDNTVVHMARYQRSYDQHCVQ